MGEFLKLQLHQNVALEDAVVKNQVDKAARFSNQDALLLRLQAKAVAQLQ